MTSSATARRFFDEIWSTSWDMLGMLQQLGIVPQPAER
jgi:hypothetical protein